MKTIYEDDIYPDELISHNRREDYRGKTIKQILAQHPNPKQFIRSFNRSNKYCLSDEIAVDRKLAGHFNSGWQRNG